MRGGGHASTSDRVKLKFQRCAQLGRGLLDVATFKMNLQIRHFVLPISSSIILVCRLSGRAGADESLRLQYIRVAAC
jgi:hypothetical protein